MDRVGDSSAEKQEVGCLDRSSRLLNRKSDDAGTRGEQKERDFLPNKGQSWPPKPVNEGLWRAPCVLGFSPLNRNEAIERPVIKEKENEGKGDKHGFGHQAQHKKDDGQQVSVETRFSHVPGVSPESEEPKERAQDILPLCDPGDRFDVERVKSEERCNECGLSLGSRQVLQYQEKQENIGNVKKHTDQVLRSGI